MIAEADLLLEPGLVIVLAAPGAGKTELLEGVAARLGAVRARASTVRPSLADETLVVDAFDEVARFGDAQVYDILHRIRDANADRILLSSRSGEWQEAKTRQVSALFGVNPLIVQLVPLSVDEQKLIFENSHPERPFDQFMKAMHQFELHHLLDNPEFLKLFAGAYDEADGNLRSRGEAFSLAIEHLGREANPDVSTTGTPSLNRRIAWANETFANLLLAGADGIAVGDLAEDSLHPQFGTIQLDGDGPPSILGTKLFRPGSGTNQHEPVHRIVAEYGAADYLATQISDQSCGLTIAQSLALIAPNRSTRDDLRGLLGWLAALGSQAIQNAVIDVDPYAVLSNGDPSRLTSSSQTRLLEGLAQLNIEEPYFRRADRGRSFSVPGLFKPDVIDAIRPKLVAQDEGHFKGLLLELLVGTPAVVELKNELQTIVLHETTDTETRQDALACLALKSLIE